jgi:hypothetical protein
MNLFRTTSTDAASAFRLPKELLAAIDAACNELDLTRSRLFRRSVTEFLKSMDSPASNNVEV